MPPAGPLFVAGQVSEGTARARGGAGADSLWHYFHRLCGPGARAQLAQSCAECLGRLRLSNGCAVTFAGAFGAVMTQRNAPALNRSPSRGRSPVTATRRARRTPTVRPRAGPRADRRSRRPAGG